MFIFLWIYVFSCERLVKKLNMKQKYTFIGGLVLLFGTAYNLRDFPLRFY